MGRGPRYSAKASWQKPHGERFYKKGGSSSLPSAPSGAGSGGARLWVKGPVPCRFLGQRPKFHWESFLAAIKFSGLYFLIDIIPFFVGVHLGQI